MYCGLCLRLPPHSCIIKEFRFELSQGIRSQIFFATFVKNIETHIKSNAMTKALKQLIHQQGYHL